MSTLDVFTYADRQVRTVVVDGEPWFVANDICAVLEHTNASMAVAGLDDDEKGLRTVDTLGGPQSLMCVNEPGLYSLIIRSRKREAKAFKRWITHEVLPAIRKTGGYGSPVGMSFEEMTAHVIEGLTERIALAEAKAKALEAPASAWEDLAASEGDVTISDAAKILGRAGIASGPRKLHDWLNVNGWIFRRSGVWVAMQTAVNAGFLVEKISDYRHPSGERRVTTQIRVTPKGLERLRSLLTEARLEVVS